MLEKLWSKFMWSFRRVPDQQRIVPNPEVKQEIDQIWIISGLFECKSLGGARGVTKAELSGTLIQRTTSEAPQRRYVLHRT